MSVITTGASPWPARCAYLSASIFTVASGGTNLIYGWQKGTDLAGSLVWAGVSTGVAIIFALSWPATIKSFEASAGLPLPCPSWPCSWPAPTA